VLSLPRHIVTLPEMDMAASQCTCEVQGSKVHVLTIVIGSNITKVQSLSLVVTGAKSSFVMDIFDVEK